MNLSKRFVKTFPFLWASGSALLYLAVRPHLLVSEGILVFSVSLALSYGYWYLFFETARIACRRSLLTLIIFIPLFLGSIFFQAVQLIHLYFFNEYITPARSALIRLNWDIIVGEVQRLMHEIAWAVVIPGVFLLIAVLILFCRTQKESVYHPLRWKGTIKILLSFCWVFWVIFIIFHPSYNRDLTPDMVGQSLQRDVVKSLASHAGFLGTTGGEWSPPSWTIRRTGLKNTPLLTQPLSTRPPNIVFILLESVRADHLELYGYPRTTAPFISALAKSDSAYAFSHAFTNSSISYFSMISIPSGLTLRRTYKEFQEAPLIWDYLKPLGYRTVMITQSIGYPRYLLDIYLKTDGLDLYRDIGQDDVKRFETEQATLARGFWSRLLKQFYIEGKIERDDRKSMAEFQKELKSTPQDQPFFGLWELECTHVPYLYEDKFTVYTPAHAYFGGKNQIGSLKNDYDNAILNCDHVIKTFFDFLRDENLADNTVVILASDHGEAFFDHGKQLFHGGSLHQEQIRVPLLIHFPLALRDRYRADISNILQCNQKRPVQLADILPTIVDFATPDRGLPPEIQLDGKSLLRPLPPDRAIYVTNAPLFPGCELTDPMFSTIDSQLLHLISYRDSARNELYDLKTDPGEAVNLWAQGKNTVSHDLKHDENRRGYQ